MDRVQSFMLKNIRVVFLSVAVLWMELTLRFYVFGVSFGSDYIRILLFSLPIAGGLALLSSMFNETVNRIVIAVAVAVLSVWYGAQCVYYNIFNAILLLDRIDLAGEALSGYSSEAFEGIVSSIPIIIAILVPIIAYVAVNIIPCTRRILKENMYRVELRVAFIYLAYIFIAQLAAIFVVNVSTDGILSPRTIYYESGSPELSLQSFGSLTTMRLSLDQMMGGEEDTTKQQPEEEAVMNDIALQPPAEEEPEPIIPEVVYDANILAIDFEQLIAQETDEDIIDMHRYFSSKEPTMQNEYTGMFEGKNLIFITAEGFWKYAVNEDYTPTLYKLANEGFVFENFYNPLWWASTTDGEFVATNGLHPLNYTRAFYETHDNLMPFTMGNMLMAEGYPTTAYHNHTYDYYNRNLTHPNMGYDYYGVGNGLEMVESWPASDLEMMEETLPQALEGELPFHNYYMTVSGHLYYTFDGNAMSSKNMEAVADLDMSEEAKAYIACNIELDKALEYIITELDKAGELENTVICLSSDHYPYGLSSDTTTEFHGEPLDETELHRSSLILWSGDMEEPVYVDKVCSSVDILPTLLNLFGLEYDSRLLTGKDILSDSPGIVLFSSQSFITDEGRYLSLLDEWQPNPDSETTDAYAVDTLLGLQQQSEYNEKIIMNDYYSYIFG